MTEHLASAHVRLHQPAFREAFEAIGRELHATKFETMPAPLRGFVRSVEALFGVRVVNKGGLELLEYVMHRGFVVGGTAMGNYLETEIMEHIFKNTAIFTVLASVDVALWTAATGEADSSGTEVSGTAYARENVAAAGWAAISDGATSKRRPARTVSSTARLRRRRRWALATRSSSLQGISTCRWRRRARGALQPLDA
jgi:hypothetical protein